MSNVQVKEIVKNILYLNSIDEIDDNASVFTELGLSSIDFIDLCFELTQQYGVEVKPDNLWPINKLILEKNYYDNADWTTEGWTAVCNIIGLSSDSEKLPLKKLYDYFTINYIEKRMEALK